MTRLATALLGVAMLAVAAGGVDLGDTPNAKADPTCQYLGQNYPVKYDCNVNQPWLPYGTPGNPPLSGPDLADCSGSVHRYHQACWRP